MSHTITMSKNDLQTLVKETVNETLSSVFSNQDFLFQILEDNAFGKILQESDNQELVSENEIFAELRK